jgi:sulfonate transport system permease protein
MSSVSADLAEVTIDPTIETEIGYTTADRSQSRFSLGRAIGLLIPLIILGLWETASHQRWVSAVFLPTPERTVAAFVDMVVNQDFYLDFTTSLDIVVQGFLYGTVLGILLGAAAGMSVTFERALGPTLNGIRHIPPIAWLPLVVLWLGIGPLAKTIIITKVVFFPVFLNTLQGIRGVQKDHVELAKVLTLTRWQMARRVIIPGALPSILVGVRYAASLAWATIVIAEGLSGLKGVGYLIFRAQALLLTDQLLVCMVVIGTVGYLIDRGMRRFERYVLRWKQGFEGV